MEKPSIDVELGGAVVIDCPIESIPKAIITWSYENGAEINFNSAER